MSWPEAPSAKWGRKKKGETNRSWILWTVVETPSTFCWCRTFSCFYAVSRITQDSSNVDSHLTVLRLSIKDSWLWPYDRFVSALSIISFYFIIATFLSHNYDYLPHNFYFLSHFNFLVHNFYFWSHNSDFFSHIFCNYDFLADKFKFLFHN